MDVIAHLGKIFTSDVCFSFGYSLLLVQRHRKAYTLLICLLLLHLASGYSGVLSIPECNALPILITDQI
jgi:hypothetical protein